MALEGSITIGLQTYCGCVRQVIIHSSRPVHAARVLHGKSISEALKMLPMLFSVCGTAQACAGVRACEQALSIQPTPYIEAMRDCLVNMETLREHLWRILLDWPAFLSEQPEKKAMTELLKHHNDYRQVLTSSNDPFQPGGEIPVYDPEELDTLVKKVNDTLEQSVFGMLAAQWLEISDVYGLQQWLESKVTIAARILASVLQRQWHDIGRCEVDALPVMDTEHLSTQLQKDEFIEQPQWLGECCETTSLTRIDSPLLQQLHNQFGNGLLVRLVARVTEMAQLSRRLLPDAQAMNNDSPACVQAHDSKPGAGIGQVAAARGQLLHQIVLQNESIIDYQILAPTEWNFHPQGVVARSLATLQGDAAQIQQQARLLINAIDPCVGYKLSITDA